MINAAEYNAYRAERILEDYEGIVQRFEELIRSLSEDYEEISQNWQGDSASALMVRLDGSRDGHQNTRRAINEAYESLRRLRDITREAASAVTQNADTNTAVSDTGTAPEVPVVDQAEVGTIPNPDAMGADNTAPEVSANTGE